MHKFKYVFVCLVFLFISFPNSVSAALVDIKKDGNVEVKVLSAQDTQTLGVPKREILEIKDLAIATDALTSKVSLVKDGDMLKINIQTSEGQKSLDVTNYKNDVVEIEERGESQKIKIFIKEGKFVLNQENVFVYTDFPLNINPESAELSVKTETGVKYISVLPKNAVDSILRARILNELGNNSTLALIEDKGILVYEINGQKKINVLNIADYKFDVKSQVSASNGEIVFTNEPVWLKLLTLFLS